MSRSASTAENETFVATAAMANLRNKDPFKVLFPTYRFSIPARMQNASTSPPYVFKPVTDKPQFSYFMRMASWIYPSSHEQNVELRQVPHIHVGMPSFLHSSAIWLNCKARHRSNTYYKK